METPVGYLLHFGFPLGFDRTSVLGHSDKNHNSTINFPSHIDKCIQEELQHKGIFGPFHCLPVGAHISSD